MQSEIPGGRGNDSEIVQLKMKRKNGLFAYRDHLYVMKKETEKFKLMYCHKKTCTAAIKIWRKGGEVTIVRGNHCHDFERENIRALRSKVLISYTIIDFRLSYLN